LQELAKDRSLYIYTRAIYLAQTKRDLIKMRKKTRSTVGMKKKSMLGLKGTVPFQVFECRLDFNRINIYQVSFFLCFRHSRQRRFFRKICPFCETAKTGQLLDFEKKKEEKCGVG
jgi:hypothetical protein